MSIITIIAILVTLCAVFSYINFKLFKLPPTIGIMVIALILSLLMLILDAVGIPVKDNITDIIKQIDFKATLLDGMLSFLLFAGALHVNLEDLAKQKWIVGIMAGFGTFFSTFLIGTTSYYLFGLFGLDIPYIYCLLLGAIISPTDPIAVMAILKSVGIKKSLETKIVGESLFNDGIAVVIFISLLQIATKGDASAVDIAKLFVQEALGGALLGLVLGYITYRMMRDIDNYQIEILLTLALVAGGYELAMSLHMSGPIAMVVAGLLIGNHGKKFAMSKTTKQNLDNFWELCDEFLNAILFLLIGLEILVLSFDINTIWLGFVLIPITLAIRFIAISIPVTLLKTKREFSNHVIKILTWGGLRGGISVALALSLPAGPERDLLLMITYIIVLFSIIVQGLTIGKLVRRSQEPTTSS